MSLIEYTLEGRINKVDIAIQRIRSFEPLTNGFFNTPYYVAYSGGKDSDCIRILCELAGVKFDLVHNHTTVDAPETVRYVRSIPDIIIDYPDISMWKLIIKKRMPPTRLVRYCCEHLKERGGQGRLVVTGVRRAESAKRKNRSSLEIVTQQFKDKIVLNADNVENRKLFEACTIQGKRVLNPIVDWTDADVWEFLHYYDCQSNPLYQCGYNRIGCIGCPMAGIHGVKRDFDRYPKYKENYIRAFQRMLDKSHLDGIVTSWITGQEVFDWWVAQYNASHKPVNGQSIIEGWELR